MRRSSLHGFIKALLQGPALFDPPEQCLSVNARLPRPVRGGLGGTVEGNHTVISPVVGLLYWRLPRTVIRLIISVRIKASYRVLFRRTRSHVPVKRLETLPFPADRNSAAPVNIVVSISRVIAPITKRCPNTVFGNSMKSVRRYALLVVTTTTSSSAISQTVSGDSKTLPTVTSNEPEIPFTSAASDETQHQKPMKFLASQVKPRSTGNQLKAIKADDRMGFGHHIISSNGDVRDLGALAPLWGLSASIP